MDPPVGYPVGYPAGYAAPANHYVQGAQGGYGGGGNSNYQYVYAQPQQQQHQQQHGNTGIPKQQHEPECRYYYPGDGDRGRRKDNSFINALAAIFIVCWCCTWPCHGPCCCGM